MCIHVLKLYQGQRCTRNYWRERKTKEQKGFCCEAKDLLRFVRNPFLVSAAYIFQTKSAKNSTYVQNYIFIVLDNDFYMFSLRFLCCSK